jgi:2-dehydropantoate 2-reductase
MASEGKIVIVGAGAMGAVYASRFFDLDESRLSLLAGGERGTRLRKEGLIVNGRRFFPFVQDPEGDAPPADLIIVAVKHHHLTRAILDMKGLVGGNTLFLSVMNGIDSETAIGVAYGHENVLYAVAMGIDAVREGNRTTYSNQGRILFGEADNRDLSPRVKRLRALFDRAEIACETPEDMIRTLWLKFMLNVGMNQVSAVLGATYGVFQTVPEARELVESTMRETLMVAHAAGISLFDKDIQNFQTVLSGMHPKGKTSMLQDVEAGRKTEVEMFGGRMMELGESHGVETPLNRALYLAIRSLEQMAQP